MPQKSPNKNTKSKATTVRKNKTTKRKVNFFSPLPRRIVAGIVVVAFAAIGVYTLTRSNAQSPCTVDDKLVNSCRAWLGTFAGGYPQVANNNQSQYAYAEKRLNDTVALTSPLSTIAANRKYDLIHRYHVPTQTTFDANEKYYYSRDNTYLYVNWKPDTVWKNAGGGNATTDARIDQMADSVKALGSKKIFLTVFHEPENDVSSGNCTNNGAGASSGSPADYVKMWHNVRARFDAKGVKNVVWTMNYMGYPGWNCLVPMLWPGNSYVDWITYDPYGDGNTALMFTNSVGPFYSYLSQNSNSTHDYLSKNWGLAEYGAWSRNSTSQTSAINYWVQATAALKAGMYPRLKMFVVFDTSDSQVGLDFSKATSIAEQAAYNVFAAAVQDTTTVAAPDPGSTSPAPAPSTPTVDNIAPTITVDTPSNNATLKGDVRVSGTAHDNVGVKLVSLRVDGVWVSTDMRSPYVFTLYTKKFKNGKHSFLLRAWDNAGNHTDSKVITIYVKN